jgi:type IV pilus assembly protein PilW
MNNQRGFNIVELMVAMVIGLFVSAAVFSVFVSSLKTNKSQDNLGRLQENVRYVLSQMQSDIRMTGYRGCLGRNGAMTEDPTPPVNNVINTINYANNFDLPLQGFHSTASSWQPSLDATISALSPTVDSDIITIRYAAGIGAPLATSMANEKARIPAAGNPDALKTGDAVLIADCEKSTVFKITRIGANGIAHRRGANSTAKLGRAFHSDAVVMPISTVTYYVSPSADKTNGSSLWRKTNNAASEELAENIEKLKILYAEDINQDLTPDKYVTANNVTDMKNVIAIKLMLLARTSDDKVSNNGQKYTFNGEADKTPTDKRIRRAFTQTITIRNKAI